jgi:hypothetical protein
MPQEARRDLVALVADKNIEQALRGLFSRPEALEAHPFSFEIYVHPERDPGCLRKAAEFLQPFTKRYSRALVVFDREGSGSEKHGREALETHVAQQLGEVGWRERAAVIALDPELEAWVWSDSPHVDGILSWKDPAMEMREWLIQIGYLKPPAVKPERPKEAMEKVLRRSRTPRSSSLYRKLAERVSFQRCSDPAFRKLRRRIQSWFPSPHATHRPGSRQE